jgi:hypothetical protein
MEHHRGWRILLDRSLKCAILRRLDYQHEQACVEGSPPPRKIKFFAWLVIEFGRRIVSRGGVGPIAGVVRFATKLKKRGLTSSPIAATPSTFEEW